MIDYSIIVNTCDAYSDLWEPFFCLLKENWPDCINREIIINTETKRDGINAENIRFVNTKYDKGDQWGGRLLHCLNEAKSDYVVVLMDDFFLREPVSLDKVELALNALHNTPEIAVFYLVDILKKDSIDGEFLGYTEVPRWKNYRLNSAPALWRKESLIRYTKETDNPWAWEYFGSCRTNHTKELFYTVSKIKEPVYDYAHAIYRGKWLGEDILPLLDRYSLNIDFKNRGVIGMDDILPKRSFKWKVQYVLTGIKMVGLEAFIPLIKDLKKKYVS